MGFWWYPRAFATFLTRSKRSPFASRDWLPTGLIRDHIV
jgi:hypothetical protein